MCVCVCVCVCVVVVVVVVVVGIQENDISMAELQVNSQESFKFEDPWSCFLLYSHSLAGWLSGTGTGWAVLSGLLFTASLTGALPFAQRPPEAPPSLWFCHSQCPASISKLTVRHVPAVGRVEGGRSCALPC